MAIMSQEKLDDQHGESALGDDEAGYDLEAYAQQVGSRLRAVRKQTRRSLQAVEALSNQEFKASVLGAYERGERSISVPRLQRLAIIYGVPVDQLLPPPPGSSGNLWREGTKEREVAPEQEPAPTNGRALSWDATGKVTIDLTKLGKVSGPERDLLRRFLNMIQVQRQDFNGRMITIRADDVRAIACLFGVTPEVMVRRLDELDLRVAA